MNIKKLSKIADKQVGFNLGGALTGGFFQRSPSKGDAEALRGLLVTQLDSWVKIGKATKRGNVCLALRVDGGLTLNLNGRRVKCIGNSREGDTVTWYFFPEDGEWGTPNEANEL